MMLATARPRPRTSIFCLVALLAVALLLGCTPKPPPPDGPPTVVSSWTDTARVVVNTLRWATPAARAVTDLVLPEPARSVVGRVLGAVGDYAGRLDVALDAYEHRGGDRCAAHAAAGGLRSALLDLAETLADNGLALGVPIGRVLDAVSSLVDNLIPACNADAGWASAGDAANARLRELEVAARARGVTLRRDLDGIRPPADAGAR